MGIPTFHVLLGAGGTMPVLRERCLQDPARGRKLWEQGARLGRVWIPFLSTIPREGTGKCWLEQSPMDGQGWVGTNPV